MQLVIFSKIVRINLFSLCIILLPLTCMGYVKGDINSDDAIGLEESIYALQVVANVAIPLSGTTINVPGDIPTIQQAIDAASNGDTINIAAGTYPGALTISGKTLVLSGAGTASTFIEGGVADAITIDHSPGVLIENLTVQTSLKGIYVLNSSSAEINQVVVKDCTDRGIQIDLNSNVKISDSTIDNSGRDGIGVLRNSVANITGTVTTQNNARRGINLFLNSSVYIFNSTFTCNGNDDSGIFANHDSSLYVDNSSLSFNTNAGNGLGGSNSSSLEISNGSNVTIETSGENGIGIWGSSRFFSAGSITIRGSVNNGLDAAGTCDVAIVGDVSIDNSGNNGFNIARTSAAFVTAKLEVLNSGEQGICVNTNSSFYTEGTANIIVKGTTGDGNGIGLWGASILRAGGGTFVIQNNSEAGIALGQNSTLELRDFGSGINANISNNKYGIALWEASYVRAEGAVSVSSNTNQGIVLNRESSCRIQGITIENNGGRGLDVNNGASIDLSSSTIRTNSGGTGDIYIGFGARSTLNGNTVIGTPLSCHATALSQGDVVCP